MAGNAYKYQFSADELINKLFQKGIISDSNTGFLQTLINKSLELDDNAYFWQEHFIVEGNEYDIDLSNLKKNPAWTVASKANQSTPMADAMAPLSDPAQMDIEGYEEKTGSIYQYGKKLYDTSLSKMELQAKLMELNVADQDLLNGYINGLARLLKTHNLTLSNLSAQALSKGGAYDNAAIKGWAGVRVSQDAYIPTANFKTAGTKVWIASDCDIPSQMQKLEYDFKVANGIPEEAIFEWVLPRTMVRNVLLNNSFFKAEVNRYIRLEAPDKVIVITSGSSGVDTDIITADQLIAYSRSSISKIAPIRIAQESQTLQTITSSSTVSGWAPNKAVLKPLGYAGVIVHANVADAKLAQSGEINNTIDINVAKAQGFLYVINKITPNGLVKAYHTDVIGRYAPVLNQIQYHVVVDTLTAD